MPSKTDSKIHKVVYFIRHGQTDHNISDVFQTPEVSLNDLGIKQSESIAERAAKIKFDALISSTMARTKQTADLIAAKTGLKVEASELFVERIKPTSINGKSFDDIEAKKIWRSWEDSLYDRGPRVEDGENFADLIKRADNILKYLESRQEQSLMVVTHGFILRTLIARILLGELLTGETHFRFQKSASMENTGISVIRQQLSFEQDYHWKLWIYNDHAHLG